MADRKTLMVVGAGASKEAGIPTSQGLKENIAGYLKLQFEDFGKRISGDDSIFEALTLASGEQEPTNAGWLLNQYLDAAWQIHTAMPQALSIDNFIDLHQGNEKIELCGKLAIVRAILHWERKSLLFTDPLQAYSKPDFKALEHT